MLVSHYEDVAQEGAAEVTARWLFHDLFSDEMKACVHGTIPHRKGVAQMASHLVLQNEYAVRCQDLLFGLLDDPERAVRQETIRCFSNEEVLAVPNANVLLGKYLHSQAYLDDPSPVLYAIKDHPGSLLPHADLICTICDVFCGALSADSRNTATGIAHDASMIPPILLRLYEQAQGQANAATVNRCLDAWDLLFEKRVGMTRDLTLEIEQ
jgi:hypothetical protein